MIVTTENFVRYLHNLNAKHYDEVSLLWPHAFEALVLENMPTSKRPRRIRKPWLRVSASEHSFVATRRRIQPRFNKTLLSGDPSRLARFSYQAAAHMHRMEVQHRGRAHEPHFCHRIGLILRAGSLAGNSCCADCGKSFHMSRVEVAQSSASCHDCIKSPLSGPPDCNQCRKPGGIHAVLTGP
ncbi:hypothetical protein P389DRAFT_24638 [Cystobasidium minutum MCA 4210]|uniref:uncharacterized protein n=1 Tax=Cystobasidium minutum MCA 4210 TaxID=1397322 RepID=UPI0034CDEB75|eukprot:jgi/Rhomi1/24638/CE24637_455